MKFNVVNNEEAMFMMKAYGNEIRKELKSLAKGIYISNGDGIPSARAKAARESKRQKT